MPVSRRWVVAAGSAACFAGISRQALAEVLLVAEASGKPMLTQKSLNAMIPKPGDPDFQVILGEASRDLRKFLGAHFTLTESQMAEIAGMPDGSRRLAQRLIGRAAEGGWGVVVEIAPVATKKGSPQAKARELQKEAEKEASNPGKFVKVYATDQSGNDPTTQVAEIMLGQPEVEVSNESETPAGETTRGGVVIY